ncbi:MAG: alpha/beta fold hydrolase, partial [Proteobacteria bacterium]|nr:alpha/beta fold hydrolase [Pseudomonadota bacterium]
GIIEQAYVGAGRALDPNKYFIIIANQIGNGLSTSPSNSASPTGGAGFPIVTIADDVVAQHKLVTERFGISKLELVLGGSMGAQQTYEWAVRFPDAVKRAAPIAGTAKVTSHNRLLVQTFIDAICSDPQWDDGWYTPENVPQRGLRRHARAFAASGFTPQLFKTEGWRNLGFRSADDFVMGFVEAHFAPQDANNLLLMLHKWQNGDVSRNANGCLKSALSKITAKLFVLAIAEDAFFPLADIEAEQSMIAGSELRRLSSPWGHLALFGTDSGYNAAIDSHLNDLLAA